MKSKIKNLARWRKNKRFQKFLLSIILGVVWIPIFQVCWLKWCNPRNTAPQIIWSIKHIFNHESSRPISWITPKAAPPFFSEAIFFAEDSNFYNHRGFDFAGMEESLEDSMFHGKRLVGASTITQQCARSVFLWQGRSWIRKIIEAYYTIWMEALLSKNRILEVYMNVAEFGDGVYGLEAAANKYFSVHAKELTPEQLSKLIAVMPNPRILKVNNLPPKVKLRQQWICNYIIHIQGSRF